MKIILCDDEAVQLQLLESYCKEWAKHNRIPCEVQCFKSAEAFLFHYEEEKDYDIAFLDIQMHDMTGMELAKKLRRLGEEMQIVFVTGNPEYVFEGYGVQALDFVVKPIKEAKFYEVLSRVQAQQKKHAKYLMLECEGVVHKLKEEELVVLESSGHDTVVHTTTQRLIYKKGMSTLEKSLDTKSFYRCHRSYSIGLRHIQSISKKEVQMEGGLSIPIARGKWEGLNQAYLAFYREVVCP
ncbi:MAG: LytR/AlgR family response regulator transcription factor [Cellulosilyticaceae bacterium]